MAHPYTKSKKHIVYSHEIENEIIYIGSGIGYRPFDFKKRNKKWLDLTENKKVIVEIIQVFDNSSDALKKEKELIIKIKPKCNINLYENRIAFTISISERELKDIKYEAKKMGLSVSSYLRFLHKGN